MVIRARQGEVITVILRNGTRLSGIYEESRNEGETHIDQWAIETDSVMAWAAGTNYPTVKPAPAAEVWSNK